MSALSETVQIICLYPPPAVSNAGSINIQNSSIEAVGNGSERIALWGGDTIINNSQIHLFNESASDANPAKFLDIHSYSLNIDHAYIATEAHNSGKGANVNVETTGVMNILNDSVIGTRTFMDATAGDINISTGKNLNILGLAKWPAIVTGIRSIAKPGSTGNAGDVTVHTQGDINLARGSGIHSRTEGLGNSGKIEVVSDNSITVSGTATDTSITPTDSGAIFVTPEGTKGGGTTDFFRGSLSTIDASSRDINGVPKGDAGTVRVTAKDILIENGGQISAVAFKGANNAGDVTVTADNIKITNEYSGFAAAIAASVQTGNGHAGTVTVNSKNLDLIGRNADLIVSSTAGNAGSITLTTDILRVDTKLPELTLTTDPLKVLFADKFGINAGLYADIKGGAFGNAGTITVQAKTVELFNTGGIEASIYGGPGNAGKITLNTNTLLLDNYSLIGSASAESYIPATGGVPTSGSGKTGGITITANDWIHLNNNSIIGINNSATVPDASKIDPGFISVTAPEIDLKNSQITTQSTGNVDAGNIYINFSKSLNLDPSFIETTANTGSGGDIFINGNGLIYLENSGFLTSVSGGVNSHGGDINVSANTLIMNTGVIQANAVGGTGGDINLNLKALIPSQNSLIKGGSRVDWQPFIAGFNVIQAASETGVNGSVNVTSPQFDISGSISGLNTAKLELPNTDKMPCQGSTNPASSLVRGSKGGIPVSEDNVGFIPVASVLPNVKSSSEKNASNTKPLVADSGKLQKNYPCASASLN